MDLNFKISKELLFVTALIQTPKPKIEGWVELQDKLWDKYKTGYRLLQGNYLSFLPSNNYKKDLDKATKQVQKLIREGMKHPVFNVLLKNAEEYKDWLEKQWEEKNDLINKELRNILKMDLPEKVSNVYVMGNLLHEGCNIDGNILWAHKEEWPNYAVVYMVHEYLHNFFIDDNIEHAIIELATDNEMRIRLNGGGEYFKCNGKNVGHKHLRKLETDIIDDWKDYLKNKDTNIYKFIEKMRNLSNKAIKLPC